jgi:GDPmannose 4,6-dehydratase
MKALIFGISGQDGFYLTRLLALHTVDFVGVSRSSGNWLQGDVSDFSFVSSVIQSLKPALIFHLAADSTTKHESLFANHEAISTGTLNILESVRLYSPHSKVFLSGSAMQFNNSGGPINESTPFSATSPYAVARIQAAYAGRYFRDFFGVHVYTGFFFNHDSPLRSERHVSKKIAAASVRIACGSKERLPLGNIFVQKEFNFAGDTVEAVWIMVNQDTIFEAVIGNGETHSIEEWANYCFSSQGLDWREHVDIDQTFKPEYMRLVSDPSLMRSMGWKTRTSFTELADMMIKAELKGYNV